MKMRSESDEVLYPDDPVVTLQWADLEEMKARAQRNPRKRIRFCSHRSPDDALHEMFIIHTDETHVRPHKHLGKAESFSVLEGAVDVILFDDDGEVTDVFPMGIRGSSKPFYYRLADPIYHTLHIKTPFLVFHEVTSGPFVREQSQFAPWAREQLDVKPYASADTETFVKALKL